MRLNRYLASGTNLSRRAADEAIRAGRVTLNGKPATLGDNVGTPDTVALDGQIVVPTTAHRYIKLHKPTGYVSSRRQQGTAPIMYDLLPPELGNLRPAGRLDLASSGLMLLSTDGEFILAMSHPSAGKTKRYDLVLDRAMSPFDALHLTRGVVLDDGPSRLLVTHHDGNRLTVELEEGRNRQIRRTVGQLGYGIVTLHRQSIGPYELGDLAPGQWEDFSL